MAVILFEKVLCFSVIFLYSKLIFRHLKAHIAMLKKGVYKTILRVFSCTRIVNIANMFFKISILTCIFNLEITNICLRTFTLINSETFRVLTENKINIGFFGDLGRKGGGSGNPLIYSALTVLACVRNMFCLLSTFQCECIDDFQISNDIFILVFKHRRWLSHAFFMLGFLFA